MSDIFGIGRRVAGQATGAAKQEATKAARDAYNKGVDNVFDTTKAPAPTAVIPPPPSQTTPEKQAGNLKEAYERYIADPNGANSKANPAEKLHSLNRALNGVPPQEYEKAKDGISKLPESERLVVNALSTGTKTQVIDAAIDLAQGNDIKRKKNNELSNAQIQTFKKYGITNNEEQAQAILLADKLRDSGVKGKSFLTEAGKAIGDTAKKVGIGVAKGMNPF